MRICNFGSLNIDRVYRVARFVKAGETATALAYAQNVGGKGLNQSVALARAGAAVCHAGCIGPDGAFLAAYLLENGVDLTCLKEVEAPTGHAVIQVEEGGQNCILIHPGANGRVTREQAETTLSRFGPGDWLLLQNEISALAPILEIGRARGMRIVLNPSPVTEELLTAPLQLVDWFILNEIEGEALTGERESERIADALVKRYPRAAFVLTLGEKGAVYAKGTERIAVPAVPVRAVDTTAAGDTFTGYFLAQITKGAPVEEALGLAAAAAALAVSRPGAAGSIPYMSEVKSP